MALRTHQRAVGTFPTRKAAEQALHDLRASGFSMDHVSVVAKDAGDASNLSGAEMSRGIGNKADEGAKAGAATGGAIGGIAGLLTGLGLLAIPGIGPIMLAGATGTALVTALSGGAIGALAGGLGGALIGLGIPEERAKFYNDRVSKGEYLVVVEGDNAEIAKAEALLHRGGIQNWGIYDAPGAVESGDRTGTRAGIATPMADVAQARIDTTDQESVKLYEERLIADKDRVKTGEVSIGKHTETETARVSIPIERERVVIERVTPTDAGVTISPDDAHFGGETMRVEVYEETADIHKEAFVREEVSIHKEVDHEVVEVNETLRREELTVDTEGHPNVDATQTREGRDRI